MIYGDAILLGGGSGGGGGGTDTTDATLSSGDQMLLGRTAYAGGVKYVGTIPTKAASDIAVSSDTVTVPAGYFAASATVQVGQTTAIERKDVNLIDYDGTILHSYTAAEFAALSVLPSNPVHAGLTSQGWTWPLADAQSFVAAYGKLDIGQSYVTDDGKTRLYISVEDLLRPDVTIMFACSAVDGVTIDWGDGSNAETSTATALTAYTHTYTAKGDYVITLAVTSGTMTWTGTSGAGGNGMMGMHGTTNLYNCGRLKKVEVGSGVTAIGSYWFYYCYQMESITIPASITSIGQYAFAYCYALRALAIPGGITNSQMGVVMNCFKLEAISLPKGLPKIRSTLLQNCYALRSVALPSGVTGIETYGFANCYALQKLTIPANVTAVGANAFNGCYSVKEYHFLASSPPTLDNTNAFTGIASDCVIYVPVGSLSTYQTATNWSSYAGHMQEETN